MATKDLTKKRWRVDIDYPNNPNNVGDVLTLIDKVDDHDDSYFKYEDQNGKIFLNDHVLDKWDGCFRPLRWWEQRSAEDMPEYFKHEDGTVRKFKELLISKTHDVSLWDNDYEYPDRKELGHEWYELEYLTPSTFEEYTTFINNRKS